MSDRANHPTTNPTTADRNKLMRSVSDLLHAKYGKALSDGKILRVLEALEEIEHKTRGDVANHVG